MNRRPSISFVEPQRLQPSRLNPEFYSREYMATESRLLSGSSKLAKLGSLARLFTGPFGSKLPASIYDTEGGIPLLRVQNIGELFLVENDLARIPRSVHEDISRSALEPGDLALAKAGRLGALSTIPGRMPVCNITQHIIGLKPQEGRISSAFLAAFMLSRYGRFQLERQGIGTLLKYLGIEETRNALVPLPPREIQEYIGAKVRLAEKCREEADRSLVEARTRFDIALRTQQFRPSGSRQHTVSSGRVLGRLNAEFYQERYFNMEDHFASLPSPVRRIESLLKHPVIRSSTPPRSETGEVPCILTTDIDPLTVSWKSPSMRVVTAVAEAHVGYLQEEDVVYTSIGPPVGEAAMIIRRHLPIIAGGDVSVLRCGVNLHPGYLCLFLNSRFGKMQNDRHARGIRQRRVYADDISDFLIPVIPEQDQTYIGTRICRYESLCEEAHDMVTQAKANVEALIEGKLDTEGILSGRVRPPTWEEVAKQMEEKS